MIPRYNSEYIVNMVLILLGDFADVHRDGCACMYADNNLRTGYRIGTTLWHGNFSQCALMVDSCVYDTIHA